MQLEESLLFRSPARKAHGNFNHKYAVSKSTESLSTKLGQELEWFAKVLRFGLFFKQKHFRKYLKKFYLSQLALSHKCIVRHPAHGLRPGKEGLHPGLARRSVVFAGRVGGASYQIF